MVDGGHGAELLGEPGQPDRRLVRASCRSWTIPLDVGATKSYGSRCLKGGPACYGLVTDTKATGRREGAPHSCRTRRAIRMPRRSVVFAPLDGTGRAELVEQRLTDAIVERRAARRRAPAERVRAVAQPRRRARHRARGARGNARRGLVRTRRGRDGGSFVTYDRDAAARLLETRVRGHSPHRAARPRSARRGDRRHRRRDRGRPRERRRRRDAAGHPRRRRPVHRRRRPPRLGRFQLEVAAISQSPRLVREEVRLQSEAGPLLWLCLREQEYRDLSAASRTRVIDAIRAVDPVAARSATIAQVDGGAGLARRREGAARGFRPPHRARTAMNTTAANTTLSPRAHRRAGRRDDRRPVRDDRRVARRARRATSKRMPPPRPRRWIRSSKPAPCPRSPPTASSPAAGFVAAPGLLVGCPLASGVVAGRDRPASVASPRSTTPPTTSSATTRRSSGGGSPRAQARGTSPARTSTTSAPTTTP